MSGYMKQAIYVLTVTVMMLLSSGCSSSDDGDSGGGDTTPTLPPTNAVLGSATAQNGLIAAQALFNVQSFAVASPARSSTLQAAMSPLLAPIPQGTVLNCDYGGTVSVSGDISDTSYDMTLSFTDCEMELGTVFKSGTIREMALFPDGYTITYLRDIYMTDVFMQIDGVNTKVFAGSQLEVRDILFDTATVELSMQTETAGEIERLDDLVMKLEQSVSGDSLCYAAGDVYVDSNLSYYLKISTEYDPLCTDAFTLDTLGTTLVSGSMELIGSDGNVSMHVTSDDNITIEGIDGTVIFTVN
jgi:hypothetical protein